MQRSRVVSLRTQCRPWSGHACCTENSTRSAHLEINHYNLDINHCERVTNKKMSAKCQQFFIRDTCFFDCEPSIGPWVEQVNRTFSKERFKHVPLCQSECDAWFDACKNDYTCAYNWPKNLNWRNGASSCKDTSRCSRISELYENSKDFCEAVSYARPPTAIYDCLECGLRHRCGITHGVLRPTRSRA